MKNNLYGAMPGVSTPIEKAPGAINTEGLTTDLSNNLNFATDGSQRKANMLTNTLTAIPAPAPDKTAILTALTVRYDSASLFSSQTLPPRLNKHIQSIHETMCGDFLVYLETKTVYCKDLNAVLALAHKSGRSK